MNDGRRGGRRSGIDIEHIAAYCPNEHCANHPSKMAGALEPPRMSYAGTELRVLALRRTHIYHCGCCGSERHFKKSSFGNRFYLMRVVVNHAGSGAGRLRRETAA